MNFITHLKVRFRNWRRNRAAKKQKSTLREFVYLDEVSVYSLIASRLGPIAAEFTETQTESLQGEIGSSLNAGAGITSAGVNSRVVTGQTHGSQVLRKSTVQTTFKELYELESTSLVIQPVPEDVEPPEICAPENIMTTMKALSADGWIVDPEKLVRGQLMEMEVQLEAESIFQVSTIFSSFIELLQEDPKIFGININNELSQMKSIGQILEKLLFGLVPIRGQATDYSIIELEEKEWIIHHKLLNKLPENNLSHTHPLCVVGVAEQSLFWKDIRRVLFSKSRFRVLCRMAQDGIQDSWTSVKLVDVLTSVLPDVANQINSLGADTLASMLEVSNTDHSTKRKQLLMHEALVVYATLLAKHYSQSHSAKDLSEVQLLSEQHCSSFDSIEGRRDAFNVIANYVLDRFGIEHEPLVIAEYRAIALTDVGLSVSGEIMPLAESDNAPSTTSSEMRFLDSEFVAIYW